MEARAAGVRCQEVTGQGVQCMGLDGTGQGRPEGQANRTDLETGEWRRVCGKARWVPVRGRKGS